MNETDPLGLCGVSFGARSYLDCPKQGAERIIGYVEDPENRIGLEKSAISLLTGVGCASPETGIGIGVCAVGIVGYYVAVEAQQGAVCTKYNRGDYSAGKAYAHNVLAWAPLPGSFITHALIVGPSAERALEHSPGALRFSGASCRRKQHLS